MNISENDNQESQTNYWDQVETAPNFNKGLTGKKLISSGHIKAEKPGETDWFRVYGEKATDLTPGLLVDVKVDVIDQKFLVIGPEEFKQQIVDGFKKAKSVYLAYYTTSSGKQGVWPVTVPQQDQHGNINSNQGDRVYDGWIAEKTDQEMFGDPQFLLTPKEANMKAFNDRVIAPDTYKSNPYVMRVLNARSIDTGIEKEKI